MELGESLVCSPPRNNSITIALATTPEYVLGDDSNQTDDRLCVCSPSSCGSNCKFCLPGLRDEAQPQFICVDERSNRLDRLLQSDEAFQIFRWLTLMLSIKQFSAASLTFINFSFSFALIWWRAKYSYALAQSTLINDGDERFKILPLPTH